ncbi:MAG TPA: Flp pilus assembly protein CpaB [Thermoleophilaceae bacterium]|nr:Flp pilus assembly protein CpaB [Thermoleophilaceae bacterium]
MSAAVRRRRAVFLLALALACGGLAASEVGGRVAEVESRTGRPVPVAVAARDVRPGARLKPADLAVRDVPSRFVPVDAARSATEAVGLEVRGGLERGAYVTAAALGGRSATARDGGATLRRGERAVQVAVAGGDPLSQAGGPGSRVDVLVSTEPRDGAGRTFLALEDVELLGLGGAPSGVASPREDGGAPPSATATLRVTQRQAVYLTAAQNFAREVRLLPRPPGDGGRGGRSAVSAAGL